MEPGERLSSVLLDGDHREENKSKQGISQGLASSPRLDRYKIARQLTEKAIKEKKIFSIYGHYPVIRAALRRKGWVEKKFHFLPKVLPNVEDEEEGVTDNKCTDIKENQDMALEKTEDIHSVMSRLVKNEIPYLLWTIKRDVVDYHSLTCDQMLNHYARTASFTTKIGLCVNMRSLPWYVQANPDSFFPRCYSLCTESEKQEFLDDFRRTAASSILKWVVSHQNYNRSRSRKREEARHRDPSPRKDPENADEKLRSLSGQLVDRACKVCQAYLGQLEHEDIDVTESSMEDLSEADWNDLTQQYYSLVHGDAIISSSRNYFSQCQALLNKITSVNPQTEIDGLRNIWIIKPAAKSRGRDIVCMDRVEEILELVAEDLPTKDNKWVVQKYIETPMLIYDTKFDIRQWFLVTDWNPLTIWFYKESYLRFSTQRFSLDNLDSAVHLCNHSIQKRLRNDQGRSPLLPGHNMWSSSRFQEYLQKKGRGAMWGSVIYPSMKRAITNAMKVAQEHVEARKNSFELYGADFILGRDFKPWLIEINSSPTMHPSTPVTAQLCAQVQEDTIKVVVDRKLDRNCDIGNFELLWRQPVVELPPFGGSDLCVEGVSMKKAKKQMPPITTFNFSASLYDAQLLKVRCPSAGSGLLGSTLRIAAPLSCKREDTKTPGATLPAPLQRPAERGSRAKPAHAEPKLALPACTCPRADSKAPKVTFPKAQPAELPDASSPSARPPTPAPQSSKSLQGTRAPSPTSAGNSRLVKNEIPYLLWTIKRDVVDYHSLTCDQMLNHYARTASFTTKIGLCVNMRSLPWYVQANPDSFFPRCYSLCTESEKQEFLDDFRRTAASSILKWVVSHQNYNRSRSRKREEARHRDPSPRKDPENADEKLRSLSGQLVDRACKVCQAYLGQLEHEDIDVTESSMEDLSEADWNDLTQQYYSLVHGDAIISSSRNYFSQCQALLNKITSVNPQTEIDGLRNIWIIKPAAKSRGRDIVCMDRVEEILELVAEDLPTKDNKWVVQKYIETPMLIYDTKFDIRQWFLVTDWNPLTIWFYKESYLRFSTQRFSLDNLDSAVHLCNHSIQKRLRNDQGRSPLLPGHNMWSSSRFQEYLQKKGRGAMWGSVIYPSMKRAITNAMKVAQEHVEARKNSFELYGADFILGRDFKPWLIEINSSPTMHPSTPVTAQLCAQVQEDTIKVVVDRKLDRNCDIGNFELLWRQPVVELPPFGGSDLCVEGVSMKKAKKQMPPITTFNFSASLYDAQLLKVRCPSAGSGLLGSTLRIAAPLSCKREDTKTPGATLPAPLQRPAERGSRAKPAHAEPKLALPACTCPRADSKAPKVTFPKAQPAELPDASSPSARPPTPAPQSSKSLQGTRAPSPTSAGPPRDVEAPCIVCRGSVMPSRPCKRCRSFCAAVLQGASFVPLSGGRPGSQWTP